MHSVLFLVIGLVGGSGGAAEYTRSLAAKNLDQPTLDAEGYGQKKSFKREDDGLRITLAPGEAETGWKTPPQLRFGGDFTVSANFVIKKLPKPAMEDGVAVGLAIAFGDINQPDVALVRLLEPAGSDVYRSVEKPMDPQQQMPGQMMMRRGMVVMMGMGGGMGQPGGKPPKPPRHTFPAAGDVFQIELEREGTTIRFQVKDAKSARPRYLGQVTLGPMDVSAVKLFVTNRNGAEAVNVLMKDFTIRAHHINGLGTVVRTVFDNVIYSDPTSLEGGILIVGGPPKPPAIPLQDLPDNVFVGDDKGPKPQDAKAATTTTAATPAPAAAAPAPAATAPPPAAPPAPAVVMAAPGVVMVAGGPEPAPGPALRAARVRAGASPAASPAQPAAPKPKVRVSLDEIESIHFERTPALAGRFMGQPNLDFTMPGLSAKKDEPAPKPDEKLATPAVKDESKKADTKKTEKKDEPKKPEVKKDESKKSDDKKDEPKKPDAKKDAPTPAPKDDAKKTDGSDDVLAPPPGTTAPEKFPKVEPKANGIRDLHLALSGLRPAKITQVTVNCQTDKGQASWRLDTTNSQDWPLVIRRSGTEMAADLFLEPPPGDCHQKPFMIAVNYEDGQAANTNVQADEHSNASLAVDPKAPAVLGFDAWVYLSGDEKLFGKVESIGQETLRLTTPWQDHLDVPLARVMGVHFGLLDRKETAESFAKRLKTRGSEDLLLAQTKKGEVIAISGVMEGTDNDKLRFRFQERTRTLPLKLVEGLIMAARPESPQDDELRPTFSLAGGVVISGRWKDLDSSVWKIDVPWGQALSLPATDIQEVRFRGGKMTYLSDLRPGKVEETPFFGHRLSWRRDVNLLGEPLKMNGQTFDRGLAVHSRCVLTYDLSGRYSAFQALVGFDDAVKGKGRVDCRVYADGKELYSNRDLRADGPPVNLKLAVDGAEQLRLYVDFGRGQDTGDRVIWANARLYRQSPLKSLAPSTASRGGSTPESAGSIGSR